MDITTLAAWLFVMETSYRASHSLGLLLYQSVFISPGGVCLRGFCFSQWILFEGATNLRGKTVPNVRDTSAT